MGSPDLRKSFIPGRLVVPLVRLSGTSFPSGENLWLTKNERGQLTATLERTPALLERLGFGAVELDERGEGRTATEWLAEGYRFREEIAVRVGVGDGKLDASVTITRGWRLASADAALQPELLRAKAMETARYQTRAAA